MKISREQPTPGFDVVTPGGFRINVSGVQVFGLLTIILLALTFAWVRVSEYSIAHGGRYVAIRGITANRDWRTGRTNYSLRADAVRAVVDATGATNYEARVKP